MTKKALITGISGQDGSYLAELLLSLGYEVHGIVRRNSVPEHQESRLALISESLTTHYGDLSDATALIRILEEIQPDEVYNLAAQSHVRISFDIPNFTAMTNAIGVLNILEAMRIASPSSKLYQASSSEMFGGSVDNDGFQREQTPMIPVSPYGVSKLFAYHVTRVYRESYGMFAANGNLFNHESPRRASNFVTSKIIKTAIQIKNGQAKKLILGNLDSYRDWGHSKDYVRAMHQILNHEVADDFVVSSGYTHSVRELVDMVFRKLNLNYQDFIGTDPKFLRPQELPYLRGDSTKIRMELGWRPEISFEQMVDEMIEFWTAHLSKEVMQN